MTDKEVLVEAFKRGHAWNPKFPNLNGLDLASVEKMDGTEADAKQLIESLQRSDANYVSLVASIHARATPSYDGEVGPATKALVGLPRCPLPDFAPPPGASFDYGDPGLNRAVARMQAATGSGSWPAGCHGTSGVHEVTISYDLSNLTSKHKEWWPEIKARSHQAVADVGIKLVEVPVGQKANITVYGRVLGGSVIGMAEFNGETCGDTVFCQLNPNYAPDIDMVLNLLLHENGHNWNLEHRSGNIMNPSILRTPTYWIKRGVGGAVEYQDNSYPTLKKFFGGESLGPEAGRSWLI